MFENEFIIDPKSLEQPEDNLAAITPATVERRYDVFQNYRDRVSGHIVGVTFSRETPGFLTYDWYRAEDGMTIDVTSSRSLHRTSTLPIVIRVRHEDQDKDLSVLRLGKTFTIDFCDNCLEHHAAQVAIIAAVKEKESPLWRLRREIPLPGFVLNVLEQPIRDGHLVGHLDHDMTALGMMIGNLREPDLLEMMACKVSIYGRRQR